MMTLENQSDVPAAGTGNEAPRFVKGSPASGGFAFAPVAAFHTSHVPFLIGIGVRTLSVDPQFLPTVQKAISGLTLGDAEAFARRLLAETTIKGVRECFRTQGPTPAAPLPFLS
jgi:hypothetical protein